ncbi:MAG: phosphotransferase [Bacteroidetes bacterium]|nr:phosphotransferase [Bacteroidota bacterium]
MTKEELDLQVLFESWAGEKPLRITPLPGSGSNRCYYRIEGESKHAMGAYHPEDRENTAFIFFTKYFHKQGLPVPELYAVNEPNHIYLLQDLGDLTLFSYLTEKRKDESEFPAELAGIYKKVIHWLPAFQILASAKLDYSVCYPRAAFDRQSMMWDLNYFKYYFLKLARVPFDEQKLEDDFITLTDFLLQAGNDYFMFRDFQSRNIMLVNDEPWFIDYQGGRKGPLQYDIVSLLYDAKAVIPQKTRNDLLSTYLDELETHIHINSKNFLKYYHGFVLIRILQAMGAYGFRGYYENKSHFLKSIPYAVENLKLLLDDNILTIHIPELVQVLGKIIEDPAFSRYKATESDLLVEITSFSYKNQIPEDQSGNGGGFVFDCRALPNPGRFEEYREFSGKDKPVIDFLQKEREVEKFLNSATVMVDQSIQNFITRNFTHLMVSFGCTGGRHRSVYCAEEMAKHIGTKYPVQLLLQHKELPDNQ